MTGCPRALCLFTRVTSLSSTCYKRFHRQTYGTLTAPRYSPPCLLQSNLSFASRPRLLSTLSAGEQKIYDAVQKGFPSASLIKVEDISGGCGAMYDVLIESKVFNGKKLIQQHMMVNQVLKSEIADMHGIRITTKPIAS